MPAPRIKPGAGSWLAAFAAAALYLFRQFLGVLPLRSIGEEGPALVLYLFLSGVSACLPAMRRVPA